MSKILVTGGSGFIGINLIRKLVEQGHSVVNFDIKPTPDKIHADLWRNIDILDSEGLRTAVCEFSPDSVYHLAARTDIWGTHFKDYAANTVGVENLLAAIDAAGTVKGAQFASSRLVCRIGYAPTGPRDYCPTTPYGESKVEGEEILHRSHPRDYSWAIIRPTSIWGPWFHVPYRNFFDLVDRGLYMHPAGMKIQKSFGYVENSVHQLIGLMNALQDGRDGTHGETFYIADYQPIEVAAWADIISDALGVRRVRHVPWAILKAGAITGDALRLLGIKFPLYSFRLDNLTTQMLHDMTNLQTIVPELPVEDVAEAVKRTVAWMREDAGRH